MAVLLPHSSKSVRYLCLVGTLVGSLFQIVLHRSGSKIRRERIFALTCQSNRSDVLEIWLFPVRFFALLMEMDKWGRTLVVFPVEKQWPMLHKMGLVSYLERWWDIGVQMRERCHRGGICEALFPLFLLLFVPYFLANKKSCAQCTQDLQTAELKTLRGSGGIRSSMLISLYISSFLIKQILYVAFL